MDAVFEFDEPAYEEVSGREWLLTNGIGGYAASSLCGSNTRRYHGLLIASFQPPTDRRVLVSGVEEKVTTGGKEFLLSTHAYGDIIHPQGYQYLRSFQRQPFPESVFVFEKNTLTKRVFMHYGHNTTVVEYINKGPDPLMLELRPLFVYRDHHHLFHEHPSWTFSQQRLQERRIRIDPGHGQPPVYMRYGQGIFYPQDDWYRQFSYARETERGLDDREDAKAIGYINAMLAPGGRTRLVFSDEEEELNGNPDQWKKEELQRMQSVAFGTEDPFVRDLMISGDQFLVWRESSSSYSIIAGYPWFTDWGRDTMIAMRGLIIAAGKKSIARSILSTFLTYLDRGMIPNRFPDSGEAPEYNTIDATLWLFVALYEYHAAFDDAEFLAQVFDDLSSILQSHLESTRYHIHVTREGLLYGGQAGTQLTWMDAKVNGHVVTPRTGCPVEINALWYNAMCIYVHFGKILGHDVSGMELRAADFPAVFQQYFFNDAGYLNDVVVPGHLEDRAIRPNQLYAVSLPFSPLTPEQARQVLEVVKRHLYTDYGLRSLSPEDPDFKPVFTGDPWHRDHAYHQGTVWSFLWGEYVLARLRVHGDSEASRQWVRERVQALRHHFYWENGIFSLSENFDGLRPDTGKGCIHQAWSAGMTLLALKKINIL